MESPAANKIFAQAEAARLWRMYGYTDPAELVLEDLALAMGVVVVEGPLDSADARLLRKGKRGLIRIKETIPEPGRKRFAIAHELGHWVMHDKISQIVACTSEDMVSLYKTSPPEIEASYFASALIMPEVVFSERIQGTAPRVKVIKKLAEEFQTSLTATAIRYVELRNDYCAMVISENGRVRWWRHSDDFKDCFWIDHGSKLGYNTTAASIFRGEPLPHHPEKIDLSEWLPEAAEKVIDSDFIYEESIPMPRYKQVLTLLWLP